MPPAWLNDLAKVYLAAALVSSLIILWDLIAGHGQKMKVMNWVWPITALYFGPFTLWAYWRFGRPAAVVEGGDKDAVFPAGRHEKEPKRTRGYVFVGSTHCGAGCTLGDILAEWAIYLAGFTIAGSELWPSYIFDFVAAFLLGIVFQYFAIAPMRGEHGWQGIKSALKADSASIAAFQIGMYGWMAITYFLLFRRPHLQVPSPTFWFMMQIGMIVGLLTTMPVNWWLLRRGLKEKM